MQSLNYSKTQLNLLVILRVLVGWHFLYEGVTKLMKPDWTSVGFLMDSAGWFAAMFKSMANSPAMVSVVDFLNVWGLIFVGLGLMLGIFAKWAKIGGIVLLALYYLSHPPFIGAEYAAPGEGTYWLVNKNLIELFTLALFMVFPTSHIIGIDRFFYIKRYKSDPDTQVAI